VREINELWVGWNWGKWATPEGSDAFERETVWMKSQFDCIFLQSDGTHISAHASI
jgi:hypothetical protein